ncbi:MAG: hypothetical protein E7604_05955 [Ruminococcaceae bacterium]|nr:hypothetical protein [Oscillospiraceae bacterium]
MVNHVFFSLEQLASIRQRAEQDAHVRTLVDAVLLDAETTMAVGALAFAYYYTGGGDYLARARKQLIAVLDDPRWESGDFPRTDLRTASLCEQMAVGYSLFADEIPAEDRRRIALTTWERGIAPLIREWVAPGHKVHAFDTMGHNWWPVCVASGAFAGIVMQDDLVGYGIAEAPAYVQMAVDGLAAWFAYPGNPMNVKPASLDHGAFYEGVTYLDYLLHEYLQFAIAYRAITGVHPFDDTPYLLDCADFLVYTSYASSKGERDYYINFGDADGYGYLHAPLHLLAYGIDHPGLRWLAQNFSDQTAEPLLRLRAYENVYDRPAYPPQATSVCYDRVGWAIFRDSWDKDAAMLAVKCGDTWNHAHADAGHFVLYRDGVNEIFDTGSPVSYSNPKYIPYYTDSSAHNTVLFEGRGQDFRDNYKNHAHTPGHLYHFVDGPGFRYIMADATGPMSRYFRKHHRHFVWVDGAVVIYDDIECYDCGRVSYVLHAEASNCHRMLTPCTTEIHEGWVEPVHGSGELEKPYKRYTVNTDTEGHAKFVSVLLLDESITPVLEEMENNACHMASEETKTSYRLTLGETVVYINTRADGKVMHRNCDNVMDGIYTDAELMVCKNGMPYAVVNGSVVREGREGRWALDVWARITGTIPENELRTQKTPS